jgi:hypothetical protein
LALLLALKAKLHFISFQGNINASWVSWMKGTPRNWERHPMFALGAESFGFSRSKVMLTPIPSSVWFSASVVWWYSYLLCSRLRVSNFLSPCSLGHPQFLTTGRCSSLYATGNDCRSASSQTKTWFSGATATDRMLISAGPEIAETVDGIPKMPFWLELKKILPRHNNNDLDFFTISKRRFCHFVLKRGNVRFGLNLHCIKSIFSSLSMSDPHEGPWCPASDGLHMLRKFQINIFHFFMNRALQKNAQFTILWPCKKLSDRVDVHGFHKSSLCVRELKGGTKLYCSRVQTAS